MIQDSDTSLAGGGAYYFAKKQINADRAARYEAELKKKQMQQSLEYAGVGNGSGTTNGGPARADLSASPSQESTLDPAPTSHAPDTEGQRLREKSKYESSEPFRSKKGDRFS
jgi:hypothetical protein